MGFIDRKLNICCFKFKAKFLEMFGAFSGKYENHKKIWKFSLQNVPTLIFDKINLGVLFVVPQCCNSIHFSYEIKWLPLKNLKLILNRDGTKGMRMTNIIRPRVNF